MDWEAGALGFIGGAATKYSEQQQKQREWNLEQQAKQADMERKQHFESLMEKEKMTNAVELDSTLFKQRQQQANDPIQMEIEARRRKEDIQLQRDKTAAGALGTLDVMDDPRFQKAEEAKAELSVRTAMAINSIKEKGKGVTTEDVQEFNKLATEEAKLIGDTEVIEDYLVAKGIDPGASPMTTYINTRRNEMIQQVTPKASPATNKPGVSTPESVVGADLTPAQKEAEAIADLDEMEKSGDIAGQKKAMEVLRRTDPEIYFKLYSRFGVDLDETKYGNVGKPGSGEGVLGKRRRVRPEIEIGI